jgi:hypothetical protein
MFIINFVDPIVRILRWVHKGWCCRGNHLEAQLEGFPRTSLCPKINTLERKHKLTPFSIMPLSVEIYENSPLGIFVINRSRFGEKRMKDDNVRYVHPIIMQQ